MIRHDGHSIPIRPIPHNGGGEVQGHRPGMDRAANGSRDGVSLSAARSRVAGHAGLGLSAAAENHQRAWLLLASAPLSAPARIPATRRRYWTAKLQRNARRDKQTIRKLRREDGRCW